MTKRKARIASTARKLSRLGKFIKGDEYKGAVINYGGYEIWHINRSVTFPSGHYVRNTSLAFIVVESVIANMFRNSDKMYGSRATLQECLELAIRQDEVVSRLTAYLQKKGLL